MVRQKKRSGCLKIFLIIIIIVVLFSLAISVLTKGTSKGAKTSAIGTGELSYYSQLNATESKLYDSILKEVSSGKTECIIENFNYNENKNAITRAVQALTYDHPEFFWLNGGAMTTSTYNPTQNNNQVNIDLSCYEYWSYTTNPQKYSDALQNKVNEITDKANKLGSDYEKALFVHDYIITSTEYDFDGLKEAQKTFHDAKSEYIYSAYGCLVNGKAVCSGYAKAYQLVLRNLGIECTYITGTANSGPHGWNCIKLDGDTYFVDVTWDDAQFSNNSSTQHPNEPEYNYFCITTDDLYQTHRIDDSVFSAPLCNNDIYNYYVHNGYLIKSYDFDSIENIINAQSSKKIISIKFSDKTALANAKKDLFDNYSWNKIGLFSSNSISYTIDEQKLIISFFVP